MPWLIAVSNFVQELWLLIVHRNFDSLTTTVPFELLVFVQAYAEDAKKILVHLL